MTEAVDEASGFYVFLSGALSPAAIEPQPNTAAAELRAVLERPIDPSTNAASLDISHAVGEALRAQAARLGAEVVDLLCVAWARTLAATASAGQDRRFEVAVLQSAIGDTDSDLAENETERFGCRIELDDRPVDTVVMRASADRIARADAALPERLDAASRDAEFTGRGRQLDAGLCVQSSPTGLQLHGLSQDARLATDACRLMAGAIAQLVHVLEHEPNAAAGELSVLSASDRQRIVHDWNVVSAEAPTTCIHELFEAQARHAPGATALVIDAERITYEELNERANRLAHHLVSLGVRPDAMVGVVMPRCADLLVAVLAVLKSGAAYVPLDPTYPAERLAYMLADSAPVALLVHDGSHLALGALPESMVVLDVVHDSHRWSEAPNTDLRAAQLGLRPTNLAYVIYTSGSTGRPKGVLVEHADVTRLFSSTRQWFGFGSHDVWTLFHSLAFDFSVWEIWGALLHGGTLVVVPYLVSRSPAQFYRLLCEQRVTVLNQTPSAFRQLVAAQAESGERQHALRTVVFGGEALDFAMLKPWYDANAGSATQLVNMYGITETTVHVTYRPLSAEDAGRRGASSIGVRIPDMRTYILDPSGDPVPVGVVGEIHVGGAGVARGYLNRPDLTAQRFLPDRFAREAGIQDARMYRTGDLGRWQEDGTIEFFGRNDAQVKLRGFRIELGEIEAEAAAYAGVREATVVVREDRAEEQKLVAYIVGDDADIAGLRAHLAAKLPAHMVPAAFVRLSTLPLSQNGKLDRAALPAPATQRPSLNVVYRAPRGTLESEAVHVFENILRLEGIGADDNFFDLGGSSLLAVKAVAELAALTGMRLNAATIFSQPTPAGLARSLSGPSPNPVASGMKAVGSSPKGSSVAIIGMAGRFPGAASVEAFWRNLVAGKDSITDFDPATLDPSIPAAVRLDPAYVNARGVLTDVECFDADFFGMPPREAEFTDPQHRLFLETAWECLEHAGYAPDATTCRVGVFAGVSTPTYLHHQVMGHRSTTATAGSLQTTIGNDKDYVATRVAYKLGLKGPAIAVNTACSTSLVAVTQALDSLRAGRCDMALAGGASVTCPVRSGHLYQEGAMLSPDARTRSFDASAQGTSFNDGVAAVLLKPLEDALADGDTIYAVIRGAAVNNDGGGKASFTAPSADGQAAVIEAALEDAGVDAGTIQYIEAHGTGTPLGDPIEVAALTSAFGKTVRRPGSCGIGSVKSNVGHLVTAAGAAGLIKTALSLSRELLPPSLHYSTPNPHIDFAASPFYVVDRLTPWPRTADRPRRAGVSSFGVGGTNAHVVLEEAPLPSPSPAATGPQLLRLSARTPKALQAMAIRLADHMAADLDSNLADVAETLRRGRSRFVHRACVAVASREAAVEELRNLGRSIREGQAAAPGGPALVWLFPGQGAQYAGMGSGLYENDPRFRAAFDACSREFEPLLPFDLRRAMFASDGAALQRTSVTQPAMFCLEYALATAWLDSGASPSIMIGHSVGEFVAAVLAGVMTLHDAARLVALRGALMGALPTGGMLSVRLSADRVAALLPPSLSLAADNGPTACVVAGPTEAIGAWQQSLGEAGIACRPLQTSHAFHSPMMDAALAPFADAVRSIRLAAPQRAIVSTLTGSRLTDEQATDPDYWTRHLREPVRFSPALHCAIAETAGAVFLEIGPRGALASLARQHSAPGGRSVVAVASLADSAEFETKALLSAQGQLWTMGIELSGAVDAQPLAGRRRVPLPTYPFERSRHWIEAAAGPTSEAERVPDARELSARRAVRHDAAILPVPSTVSPAAGTTSGSLAMNHVLAYSGGERQSRLLARLRTTFENVVGGDFAEADSKAAFLELGLDSLSLTQAALQIKRDFGVAVSFRQLMVDVRTFEMLAQFLDARLPAEAPAVNEAGVTTVAGTAPTAVASAVPSQGAQAAPSAVDASLLQQVIAGQMQLMAQQLALVGGMSRATADHGSLAAAPTPKTAAANNHPTAPTHVAPPPVAASSAVVYDVKTAFGAIARIHTRSAELTDRQQVRLDAFIRRYVDRTARSKEYTSRHRPHLADPRVVNGFRPVTKEIAYQIVVDRTKGSHLWDLDGNEYVDVLSGFGMSLFGWQPDFVIDAVRRQLDAGFEIGPQHPLAGEVAELLCELTGSQRAALCNTGSEAVMAAIRIARTVTSRNIVVSFSGSYHGTFDEVLVRAGRGGKGLPAAPGVLSGAFSDVRVLDYGTPEALDFIRANAEDIAAVLVEPVQSRRPDFQPREFLKELRALTTERGICLVFDEVITGFRCHLGGAQAVFDVRADLTCYGKVIGGGFPIGVVAGRAAYMDALDGGAWQYGDESIPSVGVTYFAGTFVRHPLALAAAKASLLHLRKEGPQLQTQLNLHTAALADELSAFCREVGAPLEVRYFSSLWRISWLADHPMQDLLFAMMRSRGVHILDNFPCFLTTAHSLEDIATIKGAFRESVAELQSADFLPRRAEASVTIDASRPPVAGARLGRDKDGTPAWFVPDATSASRFRKVEP